MIDREYAYIVSRTLENKISFAENNDQNTLLVTLDVLKDILALLKEQESVIQALKSDLAETLEVLAQKPEVVLCKDCKWWENGLCKSDDVSRKIDDCGCYPDFRTSSDWFCGDRERKD